MCFETERLRLRPFKETDAKDCFCYAKDPRVGPMAGWKPHKSIEESLETIKNVLMAPENYAVVLKAENKVIGSIGLKKSEFAKREDELELGFCIGAKYWGQGYATEAAKEILRHGFEDLHLSGVWCVFFEGNSRSKRVQEKLGFKFKAEKEDYYAEQLGETKKVIINYLNREDREKYEIQKDHNA